MVVNAAMVDANGNIVTDADSDIKFSADIKELSELSKVRLLGTSSGYTADHVPPHSDVRRSFNGLAQAVFKVYN